MGIKITKYVPDSGIGTTEKSIPNESSEATSFQDVLVLNQNALRAMTIDAMIKQSPTGSVTPDAVDAAAVMRFRSTLGDNIQSPVPKDDWKPGMPQKANLGSPKKATAPSSICNTGVLECNSELNNYFLEAANTYDIDANLLKCVAYAESNFNPNATSRSGAMGVMQLMPKTAEGLGVSDAYDAKQNIMGGAKYLSIQLERFDGDVELALAAYNAGPGNVKKYGGIPPFEETQNYVKKIMGVYSNIG